MHATLIAVCAGHRAAQGLACRMILAPIYRVVAAVLGPNSPDVADATQDAFVRVYKAIPTFQPNPNNPASANTWINKIAVRVALDRLRNEDPPMDDVVDTLEPTDDIDLDEAIDHTKLAEALLRLLDAEHRAVLVLRYWSEQTDEEIAETLGIPLGTVKTRLRTARAKLEQYVRGRAKGSKK